MKALIFKTVLTLCMFIGSTAVQLKAQQEFTKEFHKEYDANAQTRLFLNNKYGSIDVKDWDRQQIMIDVHVIVRNTSEERADRLLESIDVRFSTEVNEIRAETRIDDRFSRSVNRGNDNSFEINYTVQMPKEVNLELYNKFGNVFISELSGEALIDVKYGKLTVNKLNRGNVKPLNTVNLDYSSSSSISECNWLRTNIKYSKLTIDRATAIVNFSSYSKLFVDEASSIVIEGKYDGYEFGKLSNLVINTEYSGLRTKELIHKLDVVSKYTDFRIESIPASFESINVDSRYGTIRLGIDPEASYKLDGEASYARIFFHDTGRVSRIQENTSMKVSGMVGTNPNPSAMVRINTRYGNVRLDY